MLIVFKSSVFMDFSQSNYRFWVNEYPQSRASGYLYKISHTLHRFMVYKSVIISEIYGTITTTTTNSSLPALQEIKPRRLH